MQTRKHVLELYLLLRRQRKKKKRSYWVHPILKRRNELGQYHRLVQEMAYSRRSHFMQYFRTTPEQFSQILQLVSPLITKFTTNYRKPIGPDERLAITLKYLATGESFRSISASYRVGRSTTAAIVVDTCQALWNALQPIYLKTPTKEEWKGIAEEFWTLWNFPNCVGAIDGKHIHIKCPPNSGSLFYNYKGTYSIVLMAIADARYRFTMINVGSYGRQSDGGILQNTKFGQDLNSGSLNLPEPSVLPMDKSGTKVLYVYVADEAFALQNNMMRPFPGRNLDRRKRIFNYRLSRARRVIENTFGILAQRFRVFLQPIAVRPDRIDDIVKAACCLHNFLCKDSALKNRSLALQNDINTESSMTNLGRVGRNAATSALNIRDYLANYFNTCGSVSWQNNIIF